MKPLILVIEDDPRNPPLPTRHPRRPRISNPRSRPPPPKASPKPPPANPTSCSSTSASPIAMASTSFARSAPGARCPSSSSFSRARDGQKRIKSPRQIWAPTITSPKPFAVSELLAQSAPPSRRAAPLVPDGAGPIVRFGWRPSRFRKTPDHRRRPGSPAPLPTNTNSFKSSSNTPGRVVLPAPVAQRSRGAPSIPEQSQYLRVYRRPTPPSTRTGPRPPTLPQNRTRRRLPFVF